MPKEYDVIIDLPNGHAITNIDHFEIENIQSATPLIRINKRLYQGTHRESVPSIVYFDFVPNNDEQSLKADNEYLLKARYIGCTKSIIQCEQVILPNVRSEGSKETIETNSMES